MRFEGMLLVVKDMERSKRFYREVLSAETVMDLGTYIVFKGYCLITEGQWEELQGGPVEYKYGGNTCQLGMEEENLDAFLEHLKRFDDLDWFTPLKEYPWGQRSLRLYDPDKHIVEVGEDMKVVVKRFLRSGMTVPQAAERTWYPLPFVEMCQRELDAR